MTLLTATYALENMPVTDGNLHIVDLLQSSELIPADVADELTQAIAGDYDGFNMHAELEGPNFVVATSWDDLTADD